MTDRRLFLKNGLYALLALFTGFRRAREEFGPGKLNIDPNSDYTEVRIRWWGNIACESPKFYRDRPINGLIAAFDEALSDYVPEPEDPPRWNRLCRRWASKHQRNFNPLFCGTMVCEYSSYNFMVKVDE